MEEPVGNRDGTGRRAECTKYEFVQLSSFNLRKKFSTMLLTQLFLDLKFWFFLFLENVFFSCNICFI